jgi:competence protein ComEC
MGRVTTETIKETAAKDNIFFKTVSSFSNIFPHKTQAYTDEIGGECEILCLYPLYTEKTEISDNSGSLVLKIVCGEKSFLLTGDIGADDEEKLILLNAPIKCDVLKTAHHGSKYSTSEEFVEKINADYAVISYGKNNRYGHPSAEVKQRLENNGIIIYETAADGTITAETDGKTLKFYTSAKEEKKWCP